MNADDDGFCEHFAVMRMTDSKPDDLKILQAKGFVNVFDDRVLIILDWKENNYLRPDRYTPSKYLEIYKKDLKRLSSGLPKVDPGKDRLGEDREGKERVEIPEQSSENKSFSKEGAEILKSFEVVNPSCKNYYNRPPQRKACDDLIREYTLERVKQVIEKTLPKTNGLQFFPTITTPIQLLEKWTALESAVRKYQSEKLSTKEKYKII